MPDSRCHVVTDIGVFTMNSRREILIVDDDTDIIRATSLRLKAQGYDTVEASSGEEALARVSDHAPGLILLDVRMPGLSGLDVLRRLKSKSDTSEIPVVMVSASLVYEQEALDCGALKYLSKPCNSTTLIEAVREVFPDTLAQPQTC